MSSGISKTLNIFRKGEIPRLLESSMCCLALHFPPGNNIQAGRGYQHLHVGSPSQRDAPSAWIGCTLCVQWKLRYPQSIVHIPEIDMHQSHCTHASILLCMCKPFFLRMYRRSNVSSIHRTPCIAPTPIFLSDILNK